jgi:hypothetical protein
MCLRRVRRRSGGEGNSVCSSEARGAFLCRTRDGWMVVKNGVPDLADPGSGKSSHSLNLNDVGEADGIAV